MESKWRQNVADLGWCNGPYRLIARILGTPFPQWLAAEETGSATATILFDPLSLGFPVELYRVPILFGSHFPYGYTVEPDN